MKLKLNLLLAASAFTLFIASCGKKDNSGGSGVIPVVDKPIVQLSKTAIQADGFEETVISVKDKNGNDVTTQCYITGNGAQIVDMNYATANAGTVSIKAKLGTVESVAVDLTATAPTQRHTRKVLVEDYTGAWCGYCPRIAKSLEDLRNANPAIIPIAVHNGDALAYSLEGQMRSKWGVTGFPTAVVNRNFTWNENATQITNELPKWAPVGLAIESAVAGNNISGKVQTQFNMTSTSVPISVAVMLIENGKVLAQTNYYNTTANSPFFGLGNPITNFVQNHVLRAASGSVFGVNVPQTAVVKNNIHETTFSFNATGYVISNCYIVAVASYGDGISRKGALNAQIVKAGQTQNFD